MVERRNNLAALLMWTAFVVAITALVVITFLGFELRQALKERDDAIDLGNRIAVGQTVAIKSAVADLDFENAFLLDYCGLQKPGNQVCDKFISFLDWETSGGLYDYQPADELYGAVSVFLSAGKKSAQEMVAGWRNQDATSWSNGVQLRKFLAEFLLAIPDAQRTGSPTPTPTLTN